MSENITAVDETTETNAENQADVAPVGGASPEPQVPEGTAPEVNAAEEAPTVEEPEADGPTRKARKEAARYREQLRAVETKATAMRDQLITHNLGEGGVTVAALTAAGVDLDSLIGEDGTVSADAVQAAAATARTVLGIPNNRFNGTADQGARNRSTAPDKTPTWGSLLDPGARQN